MDVKKKSLIILTFLFSFLSFSLSSFAAQEEKVIEVKARKFSYTPHMIEVNKGDVVKIRLISEDVHHGFFLDGYGVETSSYPGKEGVVKFVADKPGRFNFRCSVTCGEFHPFMVGYLTVTPNTRFHMYVIITIALALAALLALIFKGKGENNNG